MVLKLDDKMFGEVKYFVSGEVSNTVLKLLRENGAQQVQYFSVYVTHCIVGQNAPESDISEAKELYEIPAVTVNWVLQSLKCNKVLPTGGFLAGDDDIFSGVVACLSKLSKQDKKRLWSMVTYNGGKLDCTLRSSCTHLIAAEPSGAKYARAAKCSGLKVVSPDWVLDSLRAGKRCDELHYHPRYLLPASCLSGGRENRLLPPEVEDSHFENSRVFQPDSETRAILEKLRMCLPWNKPEHSAGTEMSSLDGDVCQLPQDRGRKLQIAGKRKMRSTYSFMLYERTLNQRKPGSLKKILLVPTPVAHPTKREMAAEDTVSRTTATMYFLSDRGVADLNKRRRERQLDDGNVTYVPLLASNTSVARERSVSGGSPRQVTCGRLQKTASIAARRQAAFNKSMSSGDDQTLLPPQLCLQGSIFFVIGYDEIVSKYPCWTQVIIKYGGMVASSYGPSVTHVLCATLKESIAQQAVKQCKRCVTAYWLNDVLHEKMMRPPWLAIHLPVAFSEEKPCNDLRISISQFENEERIRVQLMVKILGAEFTHSFSKENDLLVCKEATGYKFTKACEWGIPVVNVEWLNDVYLGNPLCLPDPKQTKYQNLNVNYSCQRHLDSPLMASWEEHIQVDKHAECNDAVSSTTKRLREVDVHSQPREKKQKIDAGVQVHINNFKVVFSLTKEKENLQKKVLELGGEVVTDLKDATHLVISAKNLSTKFFCALSLARYILSDKWIEDSYVAKRFLDERAYIQDIKWKEDSKLSLYDLLKKPNREKLFKGKTFFVSPNVTPKRSIMKEVIEAAGGTVEVHSRTLESLQDAQLDTSNYFAICGSNDRHSVSHLSVNGFAVLHPSAVMISILKQELVKA